MNNKTTLLWDLPVRLFHWSLLPLILALWLLAENGEAIHDHMATHQIAFDAMLWHARLGFILLFLLLFRIVWGLCGSSSARFSQFVKAPSVVLDYAKTLNQRTGTHYAGHNPLGGWMVILLLSLIATQLFTGLFLTDEIAFEAPFYAVIAEDTAEWFEEWHELNFNLILLAVIMHVSAIAFYARVKKQNLVRPMLTGKADVDYQNHHPYSPFKPLLVAFLCGALVYGFSASYW